MKPCETPTGPNNAQTESVHANMLVFVFPRCICLGTLLLGQVCLMSYVQTNIFYGSFRKRSTIPLTYATPSQPRTNWSKWREVCYITSSSMKSCKVFRGPNTHNTKAIMQHICDCISDMRRYVVAFAYRCCGLCSNKSVLRFVPQALRGLIWHTTCQGQLKQSEGRSRHWRAPGT